MCKIFSYVVVFPVITVLCSGSEILKPGIKVRTRRDIPVDCNPFPPPTHRHHGHHGPEDGARKGSPLCCELPDIIPLEPEAIEKCRDLVLKASPPHDHGVHRRNIKRSNEESQGDNSKNNKAHLPPPPPFFPERTCLLNCAFNASGLLAVDGSLNEDLLNQKLQQTTANNTKWATSIDPVFKKCTAAAKEVNRQSDKPCKEGAAEYVKCMSRELFFNCPSDLWVTSAECNEFKNTLEKCPNLWPPHPWPHHPHGPHHNH